MGIGDCPGRSISKVAGEMGTFYMFDGSLGYPSICICQNSLSGTLKIIHSLYAKKKQHNKYWTLSNNIYA